MAGQSSAIFFWNWTEASVLGSQVLRQGLKESCDRGMKEMGENCY